MTQKTENSAMPVIAPTFKKKSAAEVKLFILHDITASRWLKNAVESLDLRDCLDAYQDALVLAQWAKNKLKENGINPGSIEI